MAKRGFRIMDGDLHTMEPDDLWEKYLDEPFRAAAPTFTREGIWPPTPTSASCARSWRRSATTTSWCRTDNSHSDGLFPDAMNEFLLRRP